MESLLILIPIAIVIVAIAVAIFFWSVKSGQYDDLDTEGKRILFDTDTPSSSAASKSTHTSKGTADEDRAHKPEGPCSK